MHFREREPKRISWLLVAALFLVVTALWVWSQEAVCALCFPPQLLEHPHATEAEHTTEKYE